MIQLDVNLVSKCPYNGSTKIIVVNYGMLPIKQTASCYLPTTKKTQTNFYFCVSLGNCTSLIDRF